MVNNINSCYIKLKEVLNSLSQSEQRVAEYILSNPRQAANQTLNEIAGQCHTSKTSVIRLCKLLGFSGYKEFCKSLVSDIAAGITAVSDYSDILQSDDIEMTMRNVSQNNILSIENTLKILDPIEVKKAVDALSNAHRIDFYGIGASGIVAIDAQNKFMRISKFCYAFSDTHQQAYAAASLSKGDVAILISYSGETRDIVETLDIVKSSGATSIGLTRYGVNLVSSKVDIKLFSTSTETASRSSATGSRIAQLSIIDILYNAVAGQMYQDVKKYLDITAAAIARKKNCGTHKI